MVKFNIANDFAVKLAELEAAKKASKMSKTAADKRNSSEKDVKELNDLYEVKPEAPKDMDYKRNLIEVAHPEPSYVGQSYDRINSLVENGNEGQNITINILRQQNTGTTNLKRYAEQDLGNTLAKIATELDKKAMFDLSNLADDCLNALHAKAMKKQAIGPLAIIGVAALATGLLYYKQHAALVNKGLEKNIDRLMADINDVITSGTGAWSLRSEYKDSLKSELSTVNEHLATLKEVYLKLDASLEQLEAPVAGDTALHITDTVNKIKNDPSFKTNYDNFRKIFPSVQTELAQLANKFSDEGYKRREVKNEGIGGIVNDFFGGKLYGGSGSLISDEFLDVVRNIPALTESMKQVEAVLDGADQAAKQTEALAKANIKDQDSPSAVSSTTAPTSPAAAPSTETTSSPIISQETKDQISDLEDKGLKSFDEFAGSLREKLK